jgi:hypothetical protein
MLNRAWVGKLLCGMLLSMAARAAAAQDAPSRDEELNDLKRRLEILEKEKEAKKTAQPAVSLMDPAEDKWFDKVKIGGGIRTSLGFGEEDAGNGKNVSRFVSLDSARLYASAKITDKISATLNTEFGGNTAVAGLGGGTGPNTGAYVRILDAIVQFQFADEFNIWVGHFLPPTDRFNLDGPYYLSTWGGPGGFPLVGDPYPGIFAGRDNGLAFWGDVMKGMFKYQVGVFNGNIPGGGIINRMDAPLYAARVTYEVFDSEPGYYTQSTYYGTKDVLAISGVVQYQRDGASIGAAGTHAVNGANIDALFEKKLPDSMIGGVITAELALYWFDQVNATDAWVGRATSWYFGVYYLIPGAIGWGQLQPFIDYQAVDSHASKAAVDTNEIDLGVNYVIKGHDARITLTWSHIERHPRGSVVGDNIQRELLLGAQVQF